MFSRFDQPLPKTAYKDILNSATGPVLEIGFCPRTAESKHCINHVNFDFCKLSLVPPKMYLVSQPWLLRLEGHRTLSTVPTFCQHYPGISAHRKSFWIYEICNIIHEPSFWPAAPSLWTMSRKTALLAQRGPQGGGTLCRNAHEYVLKQRDWRQRLPHFRHLLWPKLGPILPLLLEQLQNSKCILSSWVSLFYL